MHLPQICPLCNMITSYCICDNSILPVVTYQRDVEHCKPSPYILEVTVNYVAPAINSDNLDCVKFEELGWQAVALRNTMQVGQKVMFIPAESVLPYELGEALNVTTYLSKGRVRVTSLRGNRSEGLIVDRAIVERYLPYILKWEDPPNACMAGEALAASEISPHMHTFYKMPNILNEPNTFSVGEELLYSEKIHGTNWRVGKLPHPVTEKHQLYTGSHEVVFQDTVQNIYLRAAKEVADRLPEGILFFGEIFGKGIQHLAYGTTFGYRFFAASRGGYYIPHTEFIEICSVCDLPFVPFGNITFKDLEQIRELSEGNSTYADHIREGAVFVSVRYPERMAKCLSFEYLKGKKGKKRTERH